MSIEIVTASELAQILKVSTAAVRAWTHQGMPCLPVGRLKRFVVEDVLRWLKARQERRQNSKERAAEVVGDGHDK
jgi:phage terminase Nu1 subunit (DNA packaging protein)